MLIKVLKLSRLVKTMQFTVKTMQFTVKTSNFAKLNLGKLYYFLFWFLKKNDIHVLRWLKILRVLRHGLEKFYYPFLNKVHT